VDSITAVASGVVALAGLVFGWATTVRSQRQTAELAREGNRHAQALAELAGRHARELEQVRHDQGTRDRWEQRLEDSYMEIAITVIRVGEAAENGDLVRARMLVGLFATPDVREAFDKWLDRYEKLRFALDRREATGDEESESTRDLHSKHDMWKRQARDARFKLVDAQERLLAAMADDLRTDSPAP
jgi:hypothetical protein